MRKIIGAVFQSLDGVMQAPGGPSEDPTGGFDQGGWQFKFPDPAADETLGPLLEGDYDLLLGRRTYDIFAAFLALCRRRGGRDRRGIHPRWKIRADAWRPAARMGKQPSPRQYR